MLAPPAAEGFLEQLAGLGDTEEMLLVRLLLVRVARWERHQIDAQVVLEVVHHVDDVGRRIGVEERRHDGQQLPHAAETAGKASPQAQHQADLGRRLSRTLSTLCSRHPPAPAAMAELLPEHFKGLVVEARRSSRRSVSTTRKIRDRIDVDSPWTHQADFP
jgi:hypothetical protein